MFLRINSWLFKAGIIILMIGWATQLVPGIVHNIQEDNASGKKRDYTIEQKAAFELRSFAAGIIEKAKARGEQYSPAEYFTHREEIDCKTEELEKKYGIDVPYAQEYVNELFGLSYENIRKGHFGLSEAQQIAQKYSAKGRKTEISGPDWIKKLATIHGWIGLCKIIFSWMTTLYLRGMLLVLFWYIVSMADWRGIFETFLADKLKFLYALVAWPVMIWHYPENVVRKIVVAAELRRLGGLWRKIDPREQHLIKEIASRSKAEYQKWIADFETKNAQRFKRSFKWALVGTVLILLSQTIAPINVNAEIRNSVCIEQGKVYNEYETRMNSPGDDHTSLSPDNAPMWVEEICNPSVPCLVRRMEVFFEKLKTQELARSVFKIPVDGYLVKGFLLQTK